MTKDADPTVTNGQREPSGSRTVQNHGSRENELSSLDNLPSAPPIPVISRGWPETGDNSDTTLCHTVSQRPSKKRAATVSSSSSGCSTTSSHTPSEWPLRPSPRSPHGRRQSSGLIVRGSTYYLRLRVPRPLAGIIGKTHVMKSLGTGYRSNCTVAATLGPISQICFVRQDR